MNSLHQRLLALAIAGIGGTAAAAVSFGMAVYDAANPPIVPHVELNTPIDTGRWSITVHGGTAGSVPPTGVKPFTPTRLVMIDLDAANLSAESSNVLFKVVKLDPEVEGLRSPTTYLDRDKYLGGYINPGMPERVTLAWEWPEGVVIPKTLRLNLIGETYKLRDNLYGASGWYDTSPVAAIDVPLTEAP